jgi:cholesterol oxidase
VYLDVQIDAFKSTFQNPRWPQSVDWAKVMPAYYQKVFDMLHPSPIPEPPLKALALKAGADGTGAGDRFKLLDLAIYWGKDGSEKGVLRDDPYGHGGPPQMGCQYCGECFIGCNTHSKNTMDLTYLWLAERDGAEVYSQHKVVTLEQNRTDHPVHPNGHTIRYEDLRWKLSGSVSARILIAAGVLGSTELLLRCQGYGSGRDKVPATLPKLSPRLGQSFSGNGDFGAIGFRANRITNPMDGPTITAMLDYRDQLNEHGFIVEDGGIPDFLRAGLRRSPGGLAFGRRLARFLRDLFGAVGNRSLVEGVFQYLDFDTVRDALPYLVMGIDAANGIMSLDDAGDLKIDWPLAENLPLFREMEKTLRAITESPEPGLSGNLLLNPTWSVQKQLITVHPLGGCPMGDDSSQGVVNPEGAVFNYPNLYVADGSIVPSALGPNPSKTIGALAERIADHIIQKGL